MSLFVVKLHKRNAVSTVDLTAQTCLDVSNRTYYTLKLISIIDK